MAVVNPGDICKMNIMTGSRTKWSLIVLLTMLLCWFGPELRAQTKITLEEGPKISDLMSRFTELNKAKGTVPGWRIQILATTDFQKLENSRATFRYRYPNIPVDWQDSKPFYQLRAGAFATKLEALRIKHILSQDYAGLYLVRDDINVSELVNAY